MAIWRMRIAWWIPKATDTHSQYVILNAFYYSHNNGCTNVPQYYVIQGDQKFCVHLKFTIHAGVQRRLITLYVHCLSSSQLITLEINIFIQLLELLHFTNRSKYNYWIIYTNIYICSRCKLTKNLVAVSPCCIAVCVYINFRLSAVSITRAHGHHNLTLWRRISFFLI